jgi:hypothetical protein
MMMIVDGAVTNPNDTIAMVAFRQSFNNFTGSNWYSNNDPCGATSEFQKLCYFFVLLISSCDFFIFQFGPD